MKKVPQKILSVLLCVCLVFSCLTVSAGAVFVEAATVISAIGSIMTVYGALSTLAGLYYEEPNIIMESIREDLYGRTSSFAWCVPGSRVNAASDRIEITQTALEMIAQDWNLNYSTAGFDFPCRLATIQGSDGRTYRVIQLMCMADAQDTSGRTKQAWFLGDGSGRLLCSVDAISAAGIWIPFQKLSSVYNLVSDETLYDMAKSEGGYMKPSGNVYLVFDSSGSHILAGRDGHAYAAYPPDGSSALGSDRETTTGHSTVTTNNTTQNITQDNSITNNNYDQSVNIEDQTQILPGGVQNVIDNVYYDDNTKTYYIDSHDTTTNATNHFQYQYHINYTSITNIGTSAEYTKEYKLYYQLPDGRDSADLTREELEQLNVDIDVIPYVRYADDLDVRSLYHFDGDTRDSSYWNNETSFDWQAGASLTYLESNAFDGALYLDENPHAFKLTLPRSGDAALDWTLQFRYYQTHTPTPSRDSYVDVGGRVVLWMDGRQFYYRDIDPVNPAVLTVIPTGTWNEICIIRSNGCLYYYVNGVCYGSSVDSFKHSNTISFLFGGDQQTTKQIDELRFSRGALYTPGENYTPTSVPHDSNLTLTLPEGSEVVVDEVVRIDSVDNLLTPFGTHDWDVSGMANNFARSTTPFSPMSSYVDSSYNSVLTGYPFVFDRDFVKLYISTDVPYDGLRVAFGGTEESLLTNGIYQPKNAIFLPCFWRYADDDGDYWPGRSGLVGDWKEDTVYTFSVILDDGLYSSITFKIVPDSDDVWDLVVLSESINSDIQFFSNRLFGPSDWEYEFSGILWNSTSGGAIVRYTELVEGDTPQFTLDYEAAVYVKSSLGDPPILAVRTDIPITDQQIGGVRPSVPEKGQVWALVESGYITSLQVYNGSVWLNCDGRIWTGERWIPVSSYNVVTLQDMFDIVDATEDYEYIYTESGFWDWLQKAWKDMLSRFDTIIAALDPEKQQGSECQHVYDQVVDREASCADHGRAVYTCSKCQESFVELVDPLGHQWPVDDSILAIVQQPQDVIVPVGSTATISVVAVGRGLQYQWQYKPTSSTYWSNSTTASGSVYTVTVKSFHDGYQYRCKITDSSGATVVSNVVMLTVGDAVQGVSPVVSYTCSRCGETGTVHDGQILDQSGAAGDGFSLEDLRLDVFDGVWTVITGVLATGFGSLDGFVDGLAVLPGFFALYNPVNQSGVLGLCHFGGDIWS